MGCSGLILNNYASSDWLAEVARIAIGVSLLTAYPLIFFNFKKQIVDLTGIQKFATGQPGVVNVLVLGSITILAVYLHDVGKVSAFSGACFGTFLIYVAPAVMALRAHKLGLGLGLGPPKKKGLGSKISCAVQCAIIPLGLALAADQAGSKGLLCMSQALPLMLLMLLGLFPCFALPCLAMLCNAWHKIRGCLGPHGSALCMSTEIAAFPYQFSVWCTVTVSLSRIFFFFGTGGAGPTSRDR